MKILYICHHGGITEDASARYRVIYPAHMLRQLGHDCVIMKSNIDLTSCNFKSYDIVIFHRCFDQNNLKTSYYLRKNNIPYLLDVNDNFFVKDYLESVGDVLISNMKQMSLYASGFISATENIKSLIIKNINPECPIYLAEDIVSDHKEGLGSAFSAEGIKNLNANIISNRELDLFLDNKLSILCIIRVFRTIKKLFIFFVLFNSKRAKLHKKIINYDHGVVSNKRKRQYCKTNFERKLVKMFFFLDHKFNNNSLVNKEVGSKENNTNKSRPRVIWYGSSGTNRPHGSFGIKTLLFIMQDLIELSKEVEYELIVVSNDINEYRKIFNNGYINSHFIPWGIDAIEDLVKSSDVTIIPSAKDEFCYAKGTNRAEFSFRCGTPVVATKMPNLEVFKDCIEFDEFKLGIKKYLLDSDKSNKDVAAAQKIISDKYSEKVLANKIEDIFINTCQNYKKTVRIVALINLPQDADIIFSLYNETKNNDSIEFKLMCLVDTAIESPRVIKYFENNKIYPILISRDADVKNIAEVNWQQVDAFITSSETNAANVHKIAHDLTKHAKENNVLTFTMQHGLENIGLNYTDNRFDYGVKFASDYIFTWGEKEHLLPGFGNTLLKVIPVGKLKTKIITNKELPNFSNEKYDKIITIFENLHWERYGQQYRESFLDDLKHIISKYKNILFLIKPHHTGKFILNYKNDFELYNNSIILNPENKKFEPFTATCLIGISDAVITTPSTVAIDALIADRPLAVTKYNLELPVYQQANLLIQQNDWENFIDAVVNNDQDALNKINQGNKKFLANNLISTDAASRVIEIIKNKSYAENLKENNKQPLFAFRSDNFEVAKHKALVITQHCGATTYISFINPLLNCPTDDYGVTVCDNGVSIDRICQFMEEEILVAVIISREYQGSLGLIFVKAKELGIPVIFHLDDDLFNVPREIGKSHQEYFDRKLVKDSLYCCADKCDLIYASNHRLKSNLQKQFRSKRIFSGNIYGSYKILREYVLKKTNSVVVGYYGSVSHQMDLNLCIDSLVKVLSEYQDVKFELLGDFTLPQKLMEKYSNRITIYPKLNNYSDFMIFLSKTNWDIGISPLSEIKFRGNTSNTKWCEYTACGIPVIASNHSAYREVCANECGLLVEDNNWYEKIKQLVDQPDYRKELIDNAQKKLIKQYTPQLHIKQLVSLFKQTSNYKEDNV